jgi:hypothetical protein
MIALVWTFHSSHEGKQMNMTPILFALLVILQKSNLLISHCRKEWGEVSRLLDNNLDAGVVVHADTSVIMSNIKASELFFKYRTNIR